MVALLGAIASGFCMLFLLMLVRSIPIVRSISFLVNLGHGAVVGTVFAILIAKRKRDITWRALILGGALVGALTAAIEIPVRLMLGFEVVFAPVLSLMFGGLGAAIYAVLEHGPAAREDDDREDAYRKAIRKRTTSDPPPERDTKP